MINLYAPVPQHGDQVTTGIFVIPARHCIGLDLAAVSRPPSRVQILGECMLLGRIFDGVVVGTHIYVSLRPLYMLYPAACPNIDLDDVGGRE